MPGRAALGRARGHPPRRRGRRRRRRRGGGRAPGRPRGAGRRRGGRARRGRGLDRGRQGGRRSERRHERRPRSRPQPRHRRARHRRRGREAMKADAITLAGDAAGSVELDDAIFGLEPRADILHRMVRWQRAQRAAGHPLDPDAGRGQLLDQEDLSPEGHRRRAPRLPQGVDLPARRHLQGAEAARHDHDLTKKFRALGLRHALSAKAKAGELVVIESRRDGGGQDQGRSRSTWPSSAGSAR